jgi:hypothetical protein
MKLKTFKRKLGAIFCDLVRHSHLCTGSFGYIHCARCGVLLGDTIAGNGLYTGPGGYFQIDQSCDCGECRQSFDTLTWVDKFLCPKAIFPMPGEKERRDKRMDELIEAMKQHEQEYKGENATNH